MAEKHTGDSFRIKSAIRVGKSCSLETVAGLLNRQPNALSRRGVYRNTGSDCFVIFVNLEKKEDATPYQDYFFESSALLFWEGQTKTRIAEDSFEHGLDCHVFMHDFTKTPYIYYGRAVVLRQHINPPGTPSRFVLYLPEYDKLRHKKQMESIKEVPPPYLIGPTERKNIQTIRTKQADYRRNVINLWHGQCAVTGVDETSWLVASHIKPWRESTDAERVDPKNSLLLSPNYDKLFDRGVISFDSSNGKIILPEKMSASFWRNLDRLGITDEKELSFIPEGTEKYLDYHQKMVFGYVPSSSFDANSFVEGLLLAT